MDNVNEFKQAFKRNSTGIHAKNLRLQELKLQNFDSREGTMSMGSGTSTPRSSASSGSKRIRKRKQKNKKSSFSTNNLAEEDDDEGFAGAVNRDADGDVKMIGPLTESERLSKVQKYLEKKRNKA